MKIVAMMPVKNESWVLEHSLKSLSFCDEILVIDDNSTDNTLEILHKYDCTVIPFEKEVSLGWKEHSVRTKLLQEARKIGATHLVALDADEIFSDSFILKAGKLISNLKPGESISLPWVNVVNKDKILMPVFDKIFIMCDDGTSEFKEGFLHIPRVPVTSATSLMNLPFGVLHFQYMNEQRNIYKKTWYMMSEFLNKDRGALRINTTYNIVSTLKETNYEVSHLSKEKLPDPSLDMSVWQKKEVFNLFTKYGVDFFEPLQIWDYPELKNYFIEKYSREPKPTVPNKLLIAVNNFKNLVLGKIRARLK